MIHKNEPVEVVSAALDSVYKRGIMYNEMSDKQIDRLVFSHLHPGWRQDKDLVRVWSEGRFRPCSLWEDAGPIIQESRISIAHHSSTWEWSSYAHGISMNVVNNNPLRAAMIVFLTLQEK